MAMTPEAKAKKRVRSMLDASGAYYIMPVTGGFGVSGAPDFVGTYKGRFFGIEVKANTDLTELQKDHLHRIRINGGCAFVVRIPTDGRPEEGVTLLATFLDLK